MTSSPRASVEFVPAQQPRTKSASGVRVDIRLWGSDEGKLIRLRAPESISRQSYERFLQAVQLLVRIEEDQESV